MMINKLSYISGVDVVAWLAAVFTINTPVKDYSFALKTFDTGEFN